MGDPAAGLHPSSVNLPSIHLDRNSELCIVGYNEARKTRNRSPDLLLHQPGLASFVGRLPLLRVLIPCFMVDRLDILLRHAVNITVVFVGDEVCKIVIIKLNIMNKNTYSITSLNGSTIEVMGTSISFDYSNLSISHSIIMDGDERVAVVPSNFIVVKTNIQ